MRRASWSKSCPRSRGGPPRQSSSYARLAVATATSTSVSSHVPTSASTSPVAGSWTGNVSPVEPSRGVPPMIAFHTLRSSISGLLRGRAVTVDLGPPPAVLPRRGVRPQLRMGPPFVALASFFPTLRDDRQDDVGLLVSPRYERGFSAVHLRAPVSGVVVEEDPVAPHRDARVELRPRALAGPREVPPQDAEPDAVSGRDDHRGRPDLHVQLHRLPGGQRPALVVRVPRAIGEALLRIELPVRGSQPSVGHDALGIDPADEFDALAPWVQPPQPQEEVRVARGGGDKQLGRRGPGDLGLPFQRLGEEGEALAEGLEGGGPALGERLT